MYLREPSLFEGTCDVLSSEEKRGGASLSEDVE